MNLTPDILRQLPLPLRIEIEENALRKDLTQTELAAQQAHILSALREHQRPGRRTDLEETASGKTLPEVHATAVVGKIFGESRTQVEKRLAVAKAAKAEPELFGKLADDMNRTGRVNGPFNRLKVIRQSEAIRAEPPPLPEGPYRVIVADPPWPYEVRSEDPSHRGTHPYPQMSIKQICNMPVGQRAHKDCILWLWTTNHHVRQAFEVLDAWGFVQKTILTWFKNKIGRGDLLRGQTEHCLLAVRGKPTVQMVAQSTALRAPRGEHSAKPDEFYALVESLCPAPVYIQLFSRHRRPNWVGHGDEHPEAAE